MVPQTLETPIGCLASQSLGGNAWREGSWISLEIKRPMTHQLLEATDVGKSAGCRLSQAPEEAHLHAENHILLENMGRNNGRNNLDRLRDTWRRESNPGLLLSEGRLGAARQKC